MESHFYMGNCSLIREKKLIFPCDKPTWQEAMKHKISCANVLFSFNLSLLFLFVHVCSLVLYCCSSHGG